MAIENGDGASVGDPATDARADYDYTGDDVSRPGVVDDLEALVEGDVRFDSYSRELYATDASAYEVLPIGVVLPASTDDVATVVEYCAERDIPVLPRGGGTSLAGQSVNEAVVLDFTRYMDDVVKIYPEAGLATVQAGTILGELNAALEPHGLKFAPDPAWGDKSAVGGAIGNNSSGAHSLQYGMTEAYVESVEAVLADGTVTTLGEIGVDELRAEADADADELLPRIYAEVVRVIDEDADEVDERYPALKRNVSGYNLDALVDEADAGTVNLARLLAGSEGTLAVITEATLSLEPIPETKAVALLTYRDDIDALSDVAPILEHDPAAVEFIDRVLLDLARETTEFEKTVEMLPAGTDSVLLVEFYADSTDEGKQKVADLFADRVPDAGSEVEPAGDAAETTDEDRFAFAAMEAHDQATRDKFWKLRKSGLPVLLSRTSDAKHISFVEDTAVPPENLPEYVADFKDVLAEHDTFASYYGHAGPGVLHIRPLVNTKTVEGVDEMESIADAVADLVIEYDGSVAGEHGDGRARTQWNRRLYGDQLWQTFRDIKTAFDPDWLLNPGQVCGDVDLTENLRFDPEYEFDAGFEPALNWDNENEMQGMAELCHGCGGCRGEQETTGGVMCPTFRAANEEVLATRGRANMLRQAMSGEFPESEMFSDEFLHEVLDLCIGCKGCSRDCPSEVDMAKLKVELKHEYHQREGISLRDWLFGHTELLLRVGSAFTPVSNWATDVPGFGRLLDATVGIAEERSLPKFHRETVRKWFADRGPQVPRNRAERSVLLVPDPYTNYSKPEAGKAAVRALEAADVHVQVSMDVGDSGRPAYSRCLVDRTRAIAARNVDVLAPMIEDGWDVVVVEPSDAVMFQSDYLDLLSGQNVRTVAKHTYGVLEYVDEFRLDEAMAFDAPAEHLTYHGHCHQKATRKDHHAVGVLRRAGYEVDALDSGCCGMAGSFGYEREHLSMSKAIAGVLFDQIDHSDGDTLTVPGASCRTQLGDREGRTEEPPHPVEKLAQALE